MSPFYHDLQEIVVITVPQAIHRAAAKCGGSRLSAFTSCRVDVCSFPIMRVGSTSAHDTTGATDYHRAVLMDLIGAAA